MSANKRNINTKILPARRRTIKVFNHTFNIPLPQLIFRLEKHRTYDNETEYWLVVRIFINEQTYYLPLPNVAECGSVCQSRKTSDINEAIAIFFSSQFNDDLLGGQLKAFAYLYNIDLISRQPKSFVGFFLNWRNRRKVIKYFKMLQKMKKFPVESLSPSCDEMKFGY